jgi:RNA polymerase sigma-70 factor (ECF subfamily)
MPTSTPDAPEAAEASVALAARTAYGRLISYLAARCRDIAACEDALSDAFKNALETWPEHGVPDRPEAWLLTAARNRLRDVWRRQAVRDAGEATVLTLMDDAQGMADGGASYMTDPVFPDERLRLMFVCTHPAIAADIRTPLMLQTVLGLTSERIASSFLLKPAAMAQRLTRAKAKIRDARLSFDVPEPAEWPERLPPLLAAIYAAYGLGWGDYAGGEDAARGLADEALELGQMLLDLMPVTPELNGLVALILYCEARKKARFSNDGAFVALADQNPHLWDWSMIDRANRLLNAVQDLHQFGRYQLEAAIQSIHIGRALTGVTDWEQIVTLYEGLLHFAPSLAAGVGYAVAMMEARGPEAALGVLDSLETERMNDYQPFWAARANILQRLGRAEAAHDAFERAIGLTRHANQRDFLRARQAGGQGTSQPMVFKRPE